MKRGCILVLLEIMIRETDESHPMMMREIKGKLLERNISLERQTISEYFKYINQFTHYEIISTAGSKAKYYITNERFELAEIKVLVDAVQSSHHVSINKSNQIIEKLGLLTSVYKKRMLQRQVYVEERSKTDNEQLLYGVDAIFEAITDKKYVSFYYFDYDANLNQVFRKGKKRYHEIPICLTTDNNKYYLISYNSKHQQYLHYRVDRMSDVNVEKRIIEEWPQLLPADYSNALFGMYAGEKKNIKLQLTKDLINQMLDKFGQCIVFNQENNMLVSCKVDIYVSETFFGWIAQYCGKIKIMQPQDVRSQYIQFLSNNLKKAK